MTLLSEMRRMRDLLSAIGQELTNRVSVQTDPERFADSVERVVARELARKRMSGCDHKVKFGKDG